MNDNKKDIFDNNFEDIEQMLKPQCEFKASDTLKDEVMAKAEVELRPHRTIKLWPLVAAACIAGVIMMFLMPPKTEIEEKPLVTKAEPVPAVETKQAESTPNPVSVRVKKPMPRKAAPTIRKPRSKTKEEPVQMSEDTRIKPLPKTKEEPVQMSEETKIELLLASLNEDMPQMEEINTEEEIRQIRKRGERLISMYEENDK